MSDQTELASLKKAEHALLRLNPKLLTSGGHVNRITDMPICAPCAEGALFLSENTRGQRKRIASEDLAMVDGPTYYLALRYAGGDPIQVPGLIEANENFSHGNNRSKTCAARYRHVLSWIRRQLLASA